MWSELEPDGVKINAVHPGARSRGCLVASSCTLSHPEVTQGPAESVAASERRRLNLGAAYDGMMKTTLAGMTASNAESQALLEAELARIKKELEDANAEILSAKEQDQNGKAELLFVQARLDKSIDDMLSYMQIFDKVIQVIHFLTERVTAGDLKHERIKSLYRLLHTNQGASDAVKITDKLIDTNNETPEIVTIRRALGITPVVNMKWHGRDNIEHDQFHEAYRNLVHTVSEILNNHAKNTCPAHRWYRAGMPYTGLWQPQRGPRISAGLDQARLKECATLRVGDGLEPDSKEL